ncbi:DNA-binding protein [Streptomyces cacaoi]|uniref:DNA-binding protein n=1 Tax=Streptomyces cacaoi TaxID=1898 RepID=UPI0011F138F8|nr:DNA-binding protein [Streptomyces cacaoi]
MIPQGRPVWTETDAADAAGVSLRTWQRTHRADFEAAVARVNPGERVRLYDAAQAAAYTAGEPVPPYPEPAPHPDDLLTAAEAAAELGVAASTVRSDAADGYLHGGVDVHGRRWPRRVITARRDAGDRREQPEATGAGRPAGDPANRGRAGRRTPDPRAVEIARELAASPAGGQPTGRDIATRYGVSRTGGYRLLRQARELALQQEQPGAGD